MINRNRELEKNKQGVAPRVVTPPPPVNRSSTMIDEKVVPGVQVTPLSYNDLADKPTIPTALSELTADSTHRTVTDIEKALWNSNGNTRIVTNSGSELTTDYTIVCDKSTLMHIDLLPATGSGRIRQISNINTGEVDVTPFNADTINGEVTQKIYTGCCMDIKDYASGKWIII